jgi:drug/metabolite transporter (DMT)-like permease
MEIMTYAMISAAIILIIAAPHAFSDFAKIRTMDKILAVYMGIVVSAVAYFLWAKAFEHARHTSDVTNYMFLTPLVTTVLGFIMLKEIPDWGTVVGGIMIISSVVVFNLKGKAS